MLTQQHSFRYSQLISRYQVSYLSYLSRRYYRIITTFASILTEGNLPRLQISNSTNFFRQTHSSQLALILSNRPTHVSIVYLTRSTALATKLSYYVRYITINQTNQATSLALKPIYTSEVIFKCLTYRIRALAPLQYAPFVYLSLLSLYLTLRPFRQILLTPF